MTFSTSTIASMIAAMLVIMSQQQDSSVNAASAIDVGTCSDFAIMAGTAVVFAGATSSVNTGYVGVSPGTSITGSYVVSGGSVQANSAVAVSCAASMMTAYSAAAGTTCTNAGAPTDLTDITLTAGVYCGGTFALSAGTLTLTGSATDVFIFQAATSITTAASTSVVLTGGVLASNVFWQTGTTFSAGGSSVMVGTILAGTGITLGGGAVLNGRALAQSAITCSSGNTVNAFVAGTLPASDPSLAVTASTSSSSSSSSSQNLSDGSIAAIVIMSFVGFLAIMASVYFGLSSKKASNEESSYKAPAAGSNQV